MQSSFNFEMPCLHQIKQKLKQSQIHDLQHYFKQVLVQSHLGMQLPAGGQIGICVGSRGIRGIAVIVKTLVEYLESSNARPIIIPCMGSHGGASADGQKALLGDYGITQEKMGAPILSSMDVVDTGQTTHGLHAYMDRVATGCDALIIVNRIKAHTDFSSDIESGILKMLAIGLGNHTGASYVHSFGATGLVHHIPEIADKIIKDHVIFGIGIVEDGYSVIDRIEVMPGECVHQMEAELLQYAKQIKAKIPFKKLDYLVIEEMGKNISGSGVDTKVIGRIRFHGVPEPEAPDPDIITCLRLTPESHGNAAGVGLVDLISKKLFESIDLETTFINGATTKCPERYKIPMFLQDDRTTILTGYEFAKTTDTFADRIVLIRNTSDLEYLFVSEPLLREVAGNDSLEIVPGKSGTIEYDLYNNYRSLFGEGGLQYE